MSATINPEAFTSLLPNTFRYYFSLLWPTDLQWSTDHFHIQWSERSQVFGKWQKLFYSKSTLFWMKRCVHLITCQPQHGLGFISCFCSLSVFCLICAHLYRPTSGQIFVLVDQCVTYWLYWQKTPSGFLAINITTENRSSTELSLPASVNPHDLLLPPSKYHGPTKTSNIFYNR